MLTSGALAAAAVSLGQVAGQSVCRFPPMVRKQYARALGDASGFGQDSVRLGELYPRDSNVSPRAVDCRLEISEILPGIPVESSEYMLRALARSDVVQTRDDVRCSEYLSALGAVINGPAGIGVAGLSGHVFCLSRDVPEPINIADRRSSRTR